ncbi:MAG: hypothetical protein U5L75_02555 [Candidatus Campbellbacteria bacterium]|nr:hypothetical protein [Candidatus Campbellbacteria bacterium]
MAEDQDITVNTVDVNFNTTSSPVEDMVRRARLYADGDLIDTTSTSGLSGTSNQTVTFNGSGDLEYLIEQDSEVEFSVEVDFYATSNTGFTDGDPLRG